MANNQNRLQFVHHDECFNTVEEAKEYVVKQLDKIDRPALYGEPMVLKYKNEKDETSPNILLAIGSVGDGETPNLLNRTFFIDCASLESSIAEIEEELAEQKEAIQALKDMVAQIIKSCGLEEDGTYVAPDDTILKAAESLKQADVLLSEYIQDLEKRYALYTEDTNTVALTLDKENSGQTLSADVKLADHKTVDFVELPNIILKEENGLFTNVDLDYDEEKNSLTFSVNGESHTYNLPTETYVESGKYDIKTESLILTLNTGEEISISMEDLIEEWTVLGENSTTPIVLTKDHSSYEEQTHVKVWQDVLHADVRLANDKYNILEKYEGDNGRSLFVDGRAENIICKKDGEEISVQKALDTIKCAISPSNDNIVYRRPDGIFAKVGLTYDAATNVLTFKHTNVSGNVETDTFTLTSAKLLDDVSYDSKTECLILRFTTADGKTTKISIPIRDILNEWDVNNTNTTVTLEKATDTTSGKDLLSANVNISSAEYNIVENNGHAIYVRGTADNIRYDEDYTVEGKIKSINSTLDDKINAETDRAKQAESNLNDKITANTEAIENEVVRAEKAEKDITTALNKEISDRENAITSVTHALSDEITRAEKAEGELSTTLTEVSELANTNKEDIAKEIVRAEKAETKLSTDLTAEVTRAKTDEQVISGAVKANTESIATLTATTAQLSKDLTAEITRASEAETKLTTDLAAEVTRAKIDEQVISGALTTEVTTARQNEADLQTAIDNANTKIENEYTRATGSEKTLSDEISRVDKALVAETNRAEVAETKVATDLATEVTTRGTEITRVEKLVNDEESRAMGVEKELKDQIGDVDEDLTEEVKRATAKEDEISGNTVTNANAIAQEIIDARKAEHDLSDTLVAVSGELKSDMDGILVTYDASSNTLKFTNADGVETAYTLSEASLIDHIEYISSTKTLRIYYKVTGEASTRYVDIQVEDLFNQLEIDTTTSEAGAVHLELVVDKTVGNDILSAEVKLSEKDTNLLINDNGNLYVSNQASDIMLGDGKDVAETIAEIKNSITAETKARTDADAAIVTSVNDETKERKAADEANSEAILEEVTDRKAEITRVEGLISAEEQRAKEAEQAITASTSDLDKRLDSVETGLTKEISDRTLADTNLTNSIDTVSTDLATETTNRKSGDDALDARLQKVETSAVTLDSAIKTEVTNRESEDTKIKSLITSEQTRAEAQEKALSSSIDATNVQVNSVNEKVTKLTTSADTINSNLIQEIADRKQGDIDVKALVVGEEKRAEAAELANTNLVKTVSGNIVTLITDETTRAEKAEQANTTLVKNVSGDIVTLITEETTRAEKAEQANTTLVQTVSGNLNTLITEETTRAEKAEQANTTLVQTVSGNLNTLISNEVTRAEAKELALEQAIEKGSVKVSKSEGNIITEYSDGIYAQSSKLTYDTGSNTLTFTDANGNSSPIVLNSIDTIEDIYFDGETDELVFKYTVAGEEKTVRIKAASFFKGIAGTNDGNVTVTTALTTTTTSTSTVTGITANLDVNKIIATENSTVTLTKTDANKISASVNIATNVPHNILEVDGSNSSLFVNGEASNITATYRDKVTDVQTVISEISDDIIDLTGEVNYISGSVHDSIIILNTHTDQIRVLSGNVAELSAKTVDHEERITKLEKGLKDLQELVESGFTRIFNEIARLDKKSTIVDDDENDYIKHTFSVNGDATSTYYGNTMIHTELSEDLSRDSDDGTKEDF